MSDKNIGHFLSRHWRKLTRACLLLSIFAVSQAAFAASYKWTGSNGGCTAGKNWSNNQCWTPQVVPGPADNVLFNNTDTANATVDASFLGTITSMTVTSGYTGAITLARGIAIKGEVGLAGGTFNTSASNFYLSLSSDMVINGGTLNLNGSTVTIGGAWTKSTGTFTPGTSTVTFNAIIAKTITSGGAAFTNVNFSTATGSWTLGDALTANGNFTLSTGTLNTSGTNYKVVVSSDVNLTSGTFTLNGSTMGVGGSWTMPATTALTFNSNTSTVTFNGTGTYTITSGGKSFKNLIFNNAAGAWNLNGALTAAGYNTITAGVLDLKGNNLTMTNAFSNSGDFRLKGTENVSQAPANAVGSTVTFNATSGTGLIFSTWTYRNLVVNGSGGTFNPSTAAGVTVNEVFTLSNGIVNTTGGNFSLTLNSNVNINNGTLALNGSTVTVGGHWTKTAGTFTSGTSTVTFNASTAKTITSNGSPFTHVVFSNPTGSWTLADAFSTTGVFTLSTGTFNTSGGNYGITVSSNVNLTSGTFTANGSAISLAGNWIMSPIAACTFNANTSTVTFTGSNARTITSNVQSFASLVINASAGNPTFSVVGQLTATGNLTVTAGTLDTTASNYGISVSSDVTINGGTFTLRASTMNAGGNWNFSSGAFNALASTVNFNGAGNQLINHPNVFFNVQVNKTGGVATLASPLISTGSLTLSGGTLDTGSGDWYVAVTSHVVINGGTLQLNSSSMTVLRNWTKTTGVFDAGHSTVTFTGGNAQTLTSGNTDFYHLAVNKSPAGPLTIVGQLDVDANFTHTLGTVITQGNTINITSSCYLNGGLLTLGASTVTIGGNFARTAGTFSMGTSTFVFTGNINQSINAGTTSFYNIQINKTGGSATLAAPLLSSGTLTVSGGTFDTNNFSLTIDSHVVINGGTFDLNNSTISLLRDWTFSSGATIPGGSTVTFTGINNQTVKAGNGDLGNLVVNKTAGSLLVSGQLNVDGNLTHTVGTFNTQNNYVNIATTCYINGGVFSLGTSSVSVGADFVRTGGTFTVSASTIVFNGSAGQSISPGSTCFFNIQIDKSGGTATLAAPLLSSGTLTISGGTFDTANWYMTVASHVVVNGGTFNLNNSSMTVRRDWTVLSGVVNPGASTVTFTGGNPQNITSGGNSFFNLVINNSGGTVMLQDPLDMNGSFNHTLGTFNTNSQAISVGGNWTRAVAPLFTGTGSTVTFNSATSSRLSGPTTFYALRAVTPNTTLYFTPAATQYATGMVDFEDVYLRSVTNNSTWFFTYTGANQTLENITVQDSSARFGSTLYPDGASRDAGNNTNWDFSGKRFWVASSAGDWNDTANWSYASGGPGGASVPTSTHTVVFDGFSGKNGDCNIDSNISISSISLTGYNGRFDSQSYNITISSSFIQSSGTVILGTSVFTIGGDLTRTGGAFDDGTSTVSFTGGLVQTLTPGGTSFYHVGVNKSGGSLSLSGNLIVDGNWIISAGTFNAGTSTVTFGASSARRLDPGNQSFYRLAFNGSGSWTLEDVITAAGQLTLADGTFNANNWFVTASSDVVLNGGTLNLNASTMSVSGHWTKTAGSFLPGASTVTFIGASNKNIISGASAFQNLTINSAGSVTLQSALDVNGNFTKSAGTFVSNSFAMDVAGNWFNSGTFTGTNSTVTLSGATSQTLSGSSTFYALRAITPNTTLYFTNATTNYVTSLLDIEDIFLRSITDNATWFFTYTGSSQTILNVDVQDSNAWGGSVLNPDSQSTDSGNNRNWALGDKRYWVSAITGNWNNTANWARASGATSGGASVPTSTHTVIFDGVNGKNGSCDINITLSSAASLALTGYTGTLNTRGNTLTISGDATQTSGALILTTSTIKIEGNLTRTAGTFSTGASTVVFTGALDQSINPGSTCFFNIQIDKTNGTASLATSLLSSGTLTLTAGTFDTANWWISVASHVVIDGGTFNLNNSSVTVKRDWSVLSGVVNPGASTVTFTGGNAQSITSNGDSFFNLVINNSGGTVTLQDPLDMNGSFNHTLGTFNTNSQAISVGGNWTRAVAPLFTGTGSTVTFNSATSSRLSGPTTFYALRAVTPNTTLYFTPATTQYATGMVDLENVYLRSVTNNSTWFFTYTGSDQTLANVTVQDSSARFGSTLYPDGASEDAGNNTNWDFSGKRFWVASSAGDWNDTANWSYARGGPGGASVPMSTHTVVFDGFNNKNGDCNINVDVFISSISLVGYAGRLNSQSYDITIASAFIQNSGTVILGTSVFTIGGDLTRTGGAFDDGTSTINFTGGLAQTLTPGGTSFYHVGVNKSGGSLSLSGNLIVDGNWIISAGTFNAGTSTVTFDASSERRLDSGNQSFYRLAFTGSGSWTLEAAVTAAGQLTLTDGTLDSNSWSVTASSDVVLNGGTLNLNASTMSVSGHWTKTAGSFLPGTSTVTFIGASNKNIISGANAFQNLTINSGGSVTLQSALDVNGNFTKSAGTFVSNGFAMDVAGNWFNSGTFTGTNSTVTFSGATAQTLSGSSTFYALRAITPDTTLYFTNATTNYVTSMLDVENIFLRSVTDNATWFFTYTGSSQTILNVDVQDSNAWGGSLLLPDSQSTDSGNNRNWAFGDDRYWVASAPGNWNSSANWSRTSGGTGGASVPTSSHTVIFDGGNNKNGNCDINITLSSAASLSLIGYTGTLNTRGNTLTISGDATLTSGILTLSTSIIKLDGDLARSGGTFNAVGSTLTLTNGADQSIDAGLAILCNVFVNKTGGTATLASPLISTGSLTLSGGTLDTGSGDWYVAVTSHVVINGGTLQLNSSSMTVLRNWTKTTGVFDAGNSTVTFTGGNAQTLTSGNTDFYHLAVNKSPAGPLTIVGQLDVDANFTHTLGTVITQGNTINIASSCYLNGGLLTLGASTVTVGGNFIRTAGTFSMGTSTFVFTGNINQSINAGTTSFYNIQINKTGGSATLAAPLLSSGTLTVSGGTFDTNNFSLTIDSHVVINGGTFDLNNSTMSLQRDWTVVSGTVVPGGSTVTFTGGNTQTLLSGGKNFGNLVVNKTAGSVLVSGQLNIDGNFTNTAGTFITQNNYVNIATSCYLNGGVFSLGTSSVSIGDDFVRTGGTFTVSASTIVFNGDAGQSISPGSTCFFNIQIDKPSGTATLTAPLLSSGTLTISGGTFDTGNWYMTVASHVVVNGGTFNLNNSSMTVRRDWTVLSGAVNPGASTVTFTGGNAQSITSGGDSFFNLVINNSGGTVSLQDPLDMDGAFTHTLGTFDTNSEAINVGGSWSRAVAPLFTGTGSTVTFDGATSSRLSGPTTFYALRAVTPDTTLYFTPAATQYVTAMLDLEDVYLRSVTNNSTWFFTYTGSSQTITGVTVQDSSARFGSILYPDETSRDAGNNTNWDFSGKRFWVASSAGDWNDTANWSYARGGPGGASVPMSTHTVVFDGFNNKNGDCNINVDVFISSISLVGYAGRLNSQSYDITIASAFIQNSGTVILGTSVFTIGGDLTRTGGAFDDGTSTINFTGGLAQTLTPGGTSFYHVAVNKSGGSLTLSGNLIVDGNWIISAGTFNAGTSTVTFDASSERRLDSGNQSFYRLAFTGSGSWTLEAAVTAAGQLTLTDGTLDSNSWSVTASSDVVLNGGTLNLNASTMSVSGHWTKTAGSFLPGTSTVTFIGASNKNIISGANAFQNLTINSGGSITLQSALDVNGNFTKSAGTFVSNGFAMDVAGNWFNSGTFTGTNSTVTFSGAASQTLSGSSTFYALRAITPNTTLYFTNATTNYVTTMLDIENIFLRSITDNATWFFTYTGSSQTILNVDVQDSNAWGGSLLLPDSQSTDSGNNRNWAFGDDRYWVASAPGNWNSSANWSRTSGGTGGASVPTSSHTVVFDGGNNKNGNCDINITLSSAASLSLIGYTGTLNTRGNTLTISGDATLTSGILTLSTSIIKLDGDLIRSGGTFNAVGSTWTLTNGADQSIDAGLGIMFNFHVNKTGGVATLASPLISTGSLTLSGGTLDTGAGDWYVAVTSHVVISGGTFQLNSSSMTVFRNWTKTTGVFDAGNSTVTFTGGNAQTLTSGNTDFYHLAVNKSPAGPLTIVGQLDVDANFTHTLGTVITQGNTINIASSCYLNGGLLTLGASTVTVGGNFARTAGTFSMGTSTFVFTGDINQSINAGTTSFYNIQINKTGGSAILGAPLLSSGTLTVSAGTFDTNNFSLTIDSHVVINGGTFDLNNSTMALQRDWTVVSGTVVPGGSTVTFTGGNTQTLLSGGKNFGNLVINKTAGSILNVSGQLNVDGNLTHTLGTFNTQNNYINIATTCYLNGGVLNLGISSVTIGDDFVRTAGTFNAAASTIIFNGDAGQSISPGSTSFFNIQIDKTNGTATLAAPLLSSGTLTISGGTLDTANWWISVASHVVINGGTFNLNNSSMTVKRDWTVLSGVVNPGASTVTFTGGNAQSITSNGDSFFNLVINNSGGTVSLQDPLDMDGSFNHTLGTFDTNSEAINVGGNWTRAVAPLFTGTGSTVTFDGATSSRLSGPTTFYALRAVTPNTTLYFTPAATQYVTAMLDLEDIYLRSVTNNSTWFLMFTGSDQTLVRMTAQDSNASLGALIQATTPSADAGNNTNWDFGAPNAVTNLTALQSATGGGINLTWTAPGEDGASDTLINSTFTIQYTTDTAFASGNSWSPTAAQPAYVSRIDIATTNVNPGTTQGTTLTGLISGGTYYFRLWTKDIHSNYSPLSNGATNWATWTVLSISFNPGFYNFGQLPLASTGVASSSITVTNSGNVPQKYLMNVADPAGWTSVTSPPAADQYRFSAVFTTTTVTLSSFNASDVVTTGAQTSTISTFGIDTESSTTVKGFTVPATGQRGLWFRFEAGTQNTVGSEQAITVTVTAQSD